MKILLLFCALFLGTAHGWLSYGSWNCRRLACFLKDGQTITSANLRAWTIRTCGSIEGLSCPEANDRVAGKCNFDLNEEVRLEICNERGSKVPNYPKKLTMKVTKMGKADCISNNANNWWMDKDGDGVPIVTSICCTNYKLPWEKNGEIRLMKQC